MNHGCRDIQPHFIVTYQTSPAHHPTERALDHPTAWQWRKAVLTGQAAHNLDHKVEERRLVEQLAPIVRAVGEQMPDPRPALLEGIKHCQRAARVGDIGRRQAHHQQSAIGIDGDVTLAAVDPFGRVVATARRTGRLDGLAVDHGSSRLLITPLRLSIKHQRQIVDNLKQKAAYQTPKPPVNRLPRWKVGGQHAPLTARPHQIADGVEDFAQIGDAMTTPQGGLGQQRSDEFPLRVRQVARVTLARCSALRLARTGLFGPHDGLRLKTPLDIADRTKIVFSNRH